MTHVVNFHGVGPQCRDRSNFSSEDLQVNTAVMIERVNPCSKELEMTLEMKSEGGSCSKYKVSFLSMKKAPAA